MASAAPRTSLALHTLLLLTVLASFAACGQAIDCRRFVFAPQCRGIIAKRTVSEDMALSEPLREQRQLPESSPFDYIVPEYSPVYQRMGVRDSGDMEYLSPYVKVIHRSEKLPYQRK